MIGVTVLPFEKDVIDLLKSNSIEYSFNPYTHLLSTDSLYIQFLPNCSGSTSTDAHENILNESKEKVFILRLWEDVYLGNTQGVNSRILSMLGISKRIHARSTAIKSISQIELNKFLNENHLNITTRVKYKLGMFQKERLVAVAAFGRSCPIQSEGLNYKSHELIRFCSLRNHTVVGGLSKFIQYFIKNVNPEHIMTYVDREWSNGNSYQNLGFNIDRITPPQSFWISPDDCERYYSGELLKTRTAEQLKEEGWKQVKNLGNIKLVKFI